MELTGSNLPRKNNMDLGIGKIDVNLGKVFDIVERRSAKEPSLPFQIGRAEGNARRVSRKLQSRFGHKKFQVLTIQGGVVRRHTFKDIHTARAFREKARSSGAFENTSEITRT